MQKITSNKDLAKAIKGKRVLHMNSLGKDSIACLEWLYTDAEPSSIVSVWCRLEAGHIDDDIYFEYLKKRYKGVEWIIVPDGNEVTLARCGIYQAPYRVTKLMNHHEYISYERGDLIVDMAIRNEVDFVCFGHSKYENFTRATAIHRTGILNDGNIYPIGLWTKETLINYIVKKKIMLHPCYKYSSSGYDNPSFWKMRSAIIAKRGYWEKLLNVYPLLALDRYRYEKMLKREGKAICR